MPNSVFAFHSFQHELTRIGDWWCSHMPDLEHGGFGGQFDNDGCFQFNADKGLVLNARILWFFSEAANSLHRNDYKLMAQRAWQYFERYFDDAEQGGAYWLLNYKGQVADNKKQTYGQCFAIYALCAYYRLTGEQHALELAIDYFELIEEHCRDPLYGGYIEACTRNWQHIDDMRLSEKEKNHPKSLNTHLHLLEAYTALHNVLPQPRYRQALVKCIDLFVRHFINADGSSLRMFFDMHWHDASQANSYGHDIECSWLLWDALQSVDDNELTEQIKPLVLNLAKNCARCAITDEGKFAELLEFSNGHKSDQSVWWVQAEAMVGFYNAYQISGDKYYRQLSESAWHYCYQHHFDLQFGEWFWFGKNAQNIQQQTYKAGLWKGPYHNGRAMMELSKRVNHR
ncbi:AGE family epimerase/isomerase [Neptunicella marina]|uniref:Cellobiose 2-epimerase n=1 Tax=Neptunicella marina TaxID=2125989 RepID=A0A8J6ITY1_9ALTE|nr:AGE family epimerase/isomerase [Neptunicella marina]MBC3766189.1 AGE family epimerase/isomerase [Neptunicella marina]